MFKSLCRRRTGLSSIYSSVLVGVSLLTLAGCGSSAAPTVAPPASPTSQPTATVPSIPTSAPTAIADAATPVRTATPTGAPSSAATGSYVLLAWNDLGMHCYNPSFQHLGLLPPYNNLWAQLIRNGNPPQIVTQGIRMEYSFPDNTYSVGKTDFWDYAKAMFGVDLAPNVGLTGKGLAGEMDLAGDHFVAEGIPLTEYRDSDPTTRYPYQLAELVAFDAATGSELARVTVVAPVSTEMSCGNCHGDGGRASEHVATGSVDVNILTLHDRENAEEYAEIGRSGLLVDRQPVLCAECHASNALGAPGVGGEVPSFSNAIHDKHAEEMGSEMADCYQCHPGPETQCLRGVMATDHGLICRDCHGDMREVSRNPNPWLNEPRCDNPDCHGSVVQQDQPLYRNSTAHHGIYCEACHDSTHAIAPSREPNDAIKFVSWQGHDGTLSECTVCHGTRPAEAFPH